MNETVNARIMGVGHHVPNNVVTNKDLMRVMDTSDEWIQQRTGIRQRHYVTEGLGPADLAIHAAPEALREAALAPADLDLILLGTLSPDIDFPASACLLQRHLGVRGMPTMDVRTQRPGCAHLLGLRGP